MTQSRRNLILFGGLIALAVVAAAVAVGIAIARDDDTAPSLPGRIAVRNGCGLKHFWKDLGRRRELCLPEVLGRGQSLLERGDARMDTRNQGLRVGNADDPSKPMDITTPLGTNYAPSLSPDAKKAAFLHSAR